jgi:hypothetical protein
MKDGISGNPTQEIPFDRRDRAMQVIRRYRPMSVSGQLIILGFLALMIILVMSASLFARASNPAIFLSSMLLVGIFFVAMNAIRTQRQLNALVDLVTQGFERS